MDSGVWVLGGLRLKVGCGEPESYAGTVTQALKQGLYKVYMMARYFFFVGWQPKSSSALAAGL